MTPYLMYRWEIIVSRVLSFLGYVCPRLQMRHEGPSPDQFDYDGQMTWSIEVASRMDEVHYEIRGALAQRAHALEQLGHEIVYLNIGNPGVFGFRTPETMRQAVVENLHLAEPYGHQLGIFPAREAVAMHYQAKGLVHTHHQQVIIGNGVSELVDLSLRALLEPGDEVLIPSPDYPLWSAAVTLNGGVPVYYPCPARLGFAPDLAALEQAITPKTKALVVINPNNPTGAVYSEATLQQLTDLASKHRLLLLADEIYEGIVYEDAISHPIARYVEDGVCLSFGGLSKVYRACGYRIGWAVLTGDINKASQYWMGVEKLAALRLSANVPGQWAVQTALGGYQSIQDLVAPGGRLYETRQTVITAMQQSQQLSWIEPAGALYGFMRINQIADAHEQGLTVGLDDQAFAQALLERKHILVVPGSGFHFNHPGYFRITLLPEPAQMAEALKAMEALLDDLLGT